VPEIRTVGTFHTCSVSAAARLGLPELLERWWRELVTLRRSEPSPDHVL
jgi:hypothetical protein